MAKKATIISIGKAASITGIAEHTLRYWESEFPAFLHPQRTEGGQRRYHYSDIHMILRIKFLLKNERYSIAGAKFALEKTARNVSKLQAQEYEPCQMGELEAPTFAILANATEEVHHG